MDTPRRVAALFVDPSGPYPGLPGVECWDATRDARKYPGPHPVVAHPPCGPWGRCASLTLYQDKALAPRAVQLVRRWGGVLEHPAFSKLWNHCSLPLPGWLPDELGGFTLALYQSRFGHPAPKATWLYIVGTADVPPMPRPLPALRRVDRLCARDRRLTPAPFSSWLVAVARSCRRPSSPA